MFRTERWVGKSPESPGLEGSSPETATASNVDVSPPSCDIDWRAFELGPRTDASATTERAACAPRGIPLVPEPHGRARPCAAVRSSCANATPGPDFERVHLVFFVTRDEEHVELRALAPSGAFDLGARAHHYLLLALARRRLADAARGQPPASCGWMDPMSFAHDDTMARPLLNVRVFRIRQQFAGIGLADARNAIVRRGQSGLLRIGTGRLTIHVV